MIGWYFPLLGAAFALGIGIIYFSAEKQQVPFRDFVQYNIASVVGSIIGARLFHVLFEERIHYYMAHPLEAIQPWLGGLSVIGGLFGALGLSLFIFRKRFSLWVTLFDCTAPAFFFGLALARVGCFMNGCCFGRVTDVPWAVTYGSGKHAYISQLRQGIIEPGAATTLPIHPTQLYESFSALVIAIITLYYLRTPGRGKGKTALLGLALYMVARFIIEFYRGDRRGTWGVLSVPQVFCIASLVVVGWVWWGFGRAVNASGQTLD